LKTKILFISFSITLVAVLFQIVFSSPLEENQKVGIIKKIEIEGNKYFSQKKIQEWMSLKKSGFWSKKKFSPAKAEIDQYAIDSLYHTNGFLEAKTKISSVPWEKDEVLIKVLISEGVQTKIKSIKKEGGGLPSLARKENSVLDKVKIGGPLNFSQLEELKFEINTIYANAGYPYAQIQPKVTIDENRTGADVFFEIKAGEIVNFGEVEFAGLGKTKTKVVKRELSFKPGDIYSREKILESEQRVYSTGLFSYLSLKIKDPEGKPKSPDFVLKVAERKPAYLGFKGGLAQTQQQDLTLDFSGEWGNRNLWGSSRKLSFSAFSNFNLVKLTHWKNIKNQFKLTFVEPWFLGTRTLSNLDLFWEPGVKSAVQIYRIETYGGNLNFSREFKRYIKLWVTASYQKVNIYGIPTAEKEIYKKEQGINVRRLISFSGEKDTRENIFIPLRGSYTQFFIQTVGGFLKGDNHFVKTTFSWARYNNLGKPEKINVLATRIKLGYAEQIFKDQIVPTFDRFYLGGASTIRGYTENSLGPKDQLGKDAGGKIMAIINLEYRRELFWKFGYTVFVDCGNLWSEVKDMHFTDFRLTSGLGIQFFTPIGPLRIDYGRRIILAGDEPGGRLHLSILYAF
jgi:outer membrane protein insertion porin family